MGAGSARGWGALDVLLVEKASTAVLTDFDGTLAPIVREPEKAVPLPDAPRVLAELAEHFAAVAVVSGRPASFLADRLGAAGPRVRLFGVYGMEWVEDGAVVTAPEIEPWRGPASEVVAAARDEFAGTTVGIEDKGASVTVHWRNAPDEGPRVERFARNWGERTGLVVLEGRMAREFRPPVGADKGTVTERVASGCRAACFVGDDVGDLAAFAALDRLAESGVSVVRVAVKDVESPTELVEAADVVVEGPAEALALLGRLAGSPAASG